MRAALAIVCAVGALEGAAPEPAPAPRPVLGRAWSNPTPEVAALLTKARAGDAPAATALGRTAAAEPYLRYALLRDSDPALKAAHAELLAAVDARNVERAKKWAEAGRVDVLVEAICLARSDAAADALTEHLFAFAQACRDRAGKLTAQPGETFVPLAPAKTLREFVKDKSPQRYTDERVHLDQANGWKPALVRTNRLSSATGFWASAAVVRDGWAARDWRIPKLDSSCLFVNGDVALGDMDRCLIVTDGDVTEWRAGDAQADASWSVVIARGSVGGPARLEAASRSVCVWAGGDIDFGPKTGGLAQWVLFARGEINAPAPKDTAPKLVKAKTTDNPFGVRFFETADLGVEVEAHADGVRIKALAPGSPLAAHGLTVGDVIARVNDTRTPTAKEFRRALRRAVVWEAGVFWTKTAGPRVVPLAGALD